VGHDRFIWKWAYERYRDIENSVRVEDQIALNTVFYPEQQAALTKARRKRLGRNILRDCKKLRRLYAVTSNVSGPYEDVYQAAFSMVGYPDVSEVYPRLDQVTRLYRGQRKDTNTWPVIPKLFRNSPSNDEIRNGIMRAHGFAMVLRKYFQRNRRYWLPYGDAMAVATHYSPEADLGTWLIDLTSNPWTALFFASWKGEKDDTGVVEWINVNEWNELSAKGQNPLGALRLYKPPKVPRIAAQHAFFAEATPRLLWKLYVPFSLRFRQREGLVFEDKRRGVTESRLLPPADDLKSVAVQFKNNARTTYPYPDAFPLPQNLWVDESASQTFFAIVRSWLPRHRRNVNSWPNSSSLALRAVCEFHAQLQASSRQDRLPRDRRSLGRLSQAVGLVLNSIDPEDQRDWQEILHAVYSQVYLPYAMSDTSGEEVDAMETALQKVEKR